MRTATGEQVSGLVVAGDGDFAGESSGASGAADESPDLADTTFVSGWFLGLRTTEVPGFFQTAQIECVGAVG